VSPAVEMQSLSIGARLRSLLPGAGPMGSQYMRLEEGNAE